MCINFSSVEADGTYEESKSKLKKKVRQGKERWNAQSTNSHRTVQRLNGTEKTNKLSRAVIDS